MDNSLITMAVIAMNSHKQCRTLKTCVIWTFLMTCVSVIRFYYTNVDGGFVDITLIGSKLNKLSIILVSLNKC